MMKKNEHDLLFDDEIALENARGENSKCIAFLAADCDCSSYCALYDEEDAPITQGS